jgi:CrcB protein
MGVTDAHPLPSALRPMLPAAPHASMTLVFIAIGGAAGAMSRYLVQGWVEELAGGRFPWGTFVVNISGSFFLGVVFALAIDRALLAPEVRVPLMIGFISSYTTFSTLMLESWRLVEEGDYLFVFTNLVGSIVVGMFAVVAGLVLGRYLG